MAWANPPIPTTGTPITSGWGVQVATDLGIIGTAWTSYSPTVAGFTSATTTVTGYFQQFGKNVLWRASVQLTGILTLGSSTITVSLPATASSNISTANPQGIIGVCRYRTNAGILFLGEVALNNTTTAICRVPAATTSSNLVTWTGAAPASQAVGDTWTISGWYESA